jgi:LPPG:FO 2-phospho-L-lactate transferase
VRVVALTGGVGGAKLARGLIEILPPQDLTFIVNTGDDFVHLGNHISPDIDTLLYTLSDLADPVRGWGRRDESWAFMETLRALGGPDWFQLGDRDLALHNVRTQALAADESLTDITQRLADVLGVKAAVLPMTDTKVSTRVLSGDGWLAFQTYFVRERCEPIIAAVDYSGAAVARLTPDAAAAFDQADLFILCPSNPWLSLGPLFAVPEIDVALRTRRVPCVAISPIVAGRAIKGPTAKIMTELGLEVSVNAIAQHLRSWIDGIVIDPADAMWVPLIEACSVKAHCAPSVMVSLQDRIELARSALAFAVSLKR